MSAASVSKILASVPELRLATSLQPAGTAVATGLAEIDALLAGGLPQGRLCEIVGARSAGRTALALAIVAASTRRGEVAAIVDLDDALDPASLAAIGADLGRVLWVRPRTVADGLRAADLVLDAGGFGLAVLDLGNGRARATASAWTRLAHGAERSGTPLVVVDRMGVGSVSAHAIATLEVTSRTAVFTGRPALLDRIDSSVRLARAKFHPPGGEAALRFAAA